jgi:capsular polysaccharide biosynthesis protein
MFNRSINQAMLRSQKIYECLLVAYPKSYRAEYGPAMSQLFLDQCHDAWGEARYWGLLQLWLRVLPDLIQSSIIERFSAQNDRKSMVNKMAALFRPHPAPLFTFLAVFAMVFCLVLSASVVITFVMPEAYASTARLKVQPEGQGTPGSIPFSIPVLDYDPYFLQTTFEIIQDPVVLSPVIDKLKLNTKWGKRYNGGKPLETQTTMKFLKQRLSLDTVRNTKIIEVTVYDEDKNEAAQLANAITQSYLAYRIRFHNESAARGMAALQQVFQQDEIRIQNTTAEVEALRRQYNIGDSASAPRSPMEQPYWDKKRELDNMNEFHNRLEAKIDAENLEAKIPRYKPAEIVRQAQPENWPARPNKPLNITLGAVAGIFLASVAGAASALIAFLVGARHRKPPTATG